MPYAVTEKIFWLIGAITVAIGVWLLWPTDLYFLNDDFTHISLSADYKILQHNLWRPVCDLSIMLDYSIWGKNAWGYHFTNLLLHTVNTFFVWLFAKNLATTYQLKIPVKLFSTVAAVLFFAYAFHSETIYWIIGRSASLGLLFGLPACTFFIRRHLGKWNFLLSMIFFLIGLFTYESVWIFPLLALLFSMYSIYQKQSSVAKEWKMNALVWLVFAGNLFLKYIVIGRVVGDYEGGNLLNFSPVALVGGGIKLFLRTFLPPMQNEKLFILFGIIFSLVFLTIFLLYRKKKESAFFLLLMIGLLISYLPCVSLSVDTHGVESERFLYFPSVFAVLIISWLIISINRKYSVVLFAFFVSYHLWFLHLSRQHYFQASTITKSAYQQINLLQNKKRLFIDSLPIEVRGALVFRLGFTEGLQWMKQPGKVDSVYVLSRKTTDSKAEMATNVDVDNIALLTDTLNNQQVQPITFKQQNQIFFYNSAKDAYMIFKDGEWQVTK